MKKIIIILSLFILGFSVPSFAATVGSPEISIPEESLTLRQDAINRELDRYEFNMNIKTGLDIEVVTKRQFTSSFEVTNAELEGQSYLLKFSNNFYNIIEPYIKIGSSSFEVTWDQGDNNVKVESNNGFTWGAGVKAKILESKDYGITLALNAQYLNYNLDVDEAKLGGSKIVAAAMDEIFDISEWQISLLTSKKTLFSLGMNDCYLVPYAGITFSWIDVDVHFTQSTSGSLYSTYNASDENPVGLVFGLDIMPFFLSCYLLNFEVRLLNETAITLSGTVKL